jgi:hypothetical protein
MFFPGVFRFAILLYRRRRNSFPFIAALPAYSAGKAAMNGEEFLRLLYNKIANLKTPGKNIADYMVSLEGEARTVFTTILPTAAALRQRNARMINPGINFQELFEETKTFCLEAIDSVL